MEKYTEQLSTSQKNLLFATQNGTFADVKILLNRFPSFAADETFSYVILVAALHRGHKSISTLLIQSGCRVTSSFKTNHYHTPLYYAIQSNDMNLFKILLKKKASLHATDANSQTPLELAMLAQESKFMDLILLNQDYGNINPNSRDDVAIFHLACYKGIVDIMKGFLQCGFSVNSRSDFQAEKWAGCSSLHFSLKGCWHRNAAVSLLLGHHVDFDIQDKLGNTPIILAIQELDRNSDAELLNGIFKAFVQAFDIRCLINPINKFGLSHFHILCSINWDDDKNGNNLTKLLKILKCFIMKKVDINSSNHLSKDSGEFYYTGYTALHWAASESCVDILKLLLQKGAKPNKVDEQGNTPLHIIDYENVKSPKMAELLLNYGANVDQQNYQRRTPLHCAFYGRKEDQSLMHFLLCRSRTTVNLTDNYGLSYLHIASTVDLRKVEIFVNNGASVKSCIESDVGEFFGYSALHFAVIFNQVEIVEYLIAQGAEVNPCILKNESVSLSPLLLACTEQIKCLLESCHGNSEDADRSMESKNGVLNSQEEDSDWISNRKDQARIITLLLEHGASVNAEDSMKMTPLSKACEIPSSINKNSYVCTGSSKRFILDEIILRKKMMIDILLRHGADVNFRGTGGRSLLHTLFERSDKCREIKDLAEILLKGGADVDVTDDDGLSPLHLVIKNSTCHRFGKTLFHRDSFFVDLLLKYGANVNSKSNDLSSPLHTAVKYYHVDPDREKIFLKLLDHPDIDLNAQDNVSDTPLHVAIRMRKLFCIQSLLDAGADINVENVDGHSPISLFHDWLTKLIVTGTRRLEECFHVNDCKIHKAIVIHVKKLKKLNYHLSSEVNICFKELLNYRTKNDAGIDQTIDDEIKSLKYVKFDNHLSLWDFLIKNPNEIDDYTKSQVSEKLLHPQFQKDFTLFSGFLKKKLRELSTKINQTNGSIKKVVEPSRKSYQRMNVDTSTVEDEEPRAKNARHN